MVFEDIVLRIRSIFQPQGFKRARSELAMIRKVAKRTGIAMVKPAEATRVALERYGAKATTAARITQTRVDMMKRRFSKLGIEIGKVGKKTYEARDATTGWAISGKEAINRLTRQTMRFKMHMLSVMFFGMFMQRIFMNFLKTSIAMYMQVTEGQTKAGKAMLRAQAAWEFFKFSIIDALTPLLIYFTELFVKTTDWISQHPKLTQGIGIFVTMAAALGTALYFIGTMSLGLMGITRWLTEIGILGGAKLGAPTGASVAAGAGIALSKILLLGAALAGLAIIAGFVGVAIYEYLKESAVRSRLSQKAELSYSMQDWEKYYMYIRAETEVATSDMKWAFKKALHTVGSFLIKYVLIPILKGFAKIWSLFARIPGLGYLKETAKAFRRSASEWQERVVDAEFNMAVAAQKRKEMIIKSLIEQGMALEDIYDLYRENINMVHKVALETGKSYSDIDQAYRNYYLAMKEAQEETWYWRENIGAITETVAKEVTPLIEAGMPAARMGMAPPAQTTNITLNPTYNISGAMVSDEMKRILEDHDRELLSEIRRIKLPGV